MRINLPLALQIAGMLHLGLICAGALMPRAVNLRSHIATLPPFLRRLFWVYFTFIGLSLVSFGTITVAFAETLASGSGLASAVRVFRRVLDVAIVCRNVCFRRSTISDEWLLRLGYHTTNLVFIYLPIVYVWAAWKGGTP